MSIEGVGFHELLYRSEFWRPLGEPFLTRGDHLQDFPPGCRIARERILEGSKLQGFFDGKLPRLSVLNYSHRLIEHDLERRGPARSGPLGSAFWIAADTFAELTGDGRPPRF